MLKKKNKEIINITKIIKTRMVEMDMTPEQLAEKTGFSMKMVNEILNGNLDLSIKEISSLEIALECSLLVIPDTQRIITVTMNIDSARHHADTDCEVFENGIKKEMWTPTQLLSTGNTLIKIGLQMLEDVNSFLIEQT